MKPSASYLHLKDSYFENQDRDHGHIIKLVHEDVSKLLKKTLFGDFIEEYGELLLPNLFKHLSTYEKQYKNSNKDNHLSKMLSLERTKLIEVEFTMKGRKTDFKITCKKKPQNDIETFPSNGSSEFSQAPKSRKKQNMKTKKYQIMAKITANERINIYLTNRSVCMLMEFIEYSFDKNNQFLKREKCYNTEYKELLYCLQNHGNINDILKDQKIQNRDKQFKVNLQRISLKIYNENVYFQNVGELKLQFSDILIKTLDPSDFFE